MMYMWNAYRDEMMKVRRGTVPKNTKTEIENMLPPHLYIDIDFDIDIDIDIDIGIDAEGDCTNKKVNEDATGSDVYWHRQLFLDVSVNEEAGVAATGDNDDAISEEEPPGCYDNIVTHTLHPVINFAALKADCGDFTFEEWAAHLKIRKVQERRENENENEALTPPIRKKNLAL